MAKKLHSLPRSVGASLEQCDPIIGQYASGTDLPSGGWAEVKSKKKERGILLWQIDFCFASASSFTADENCGAL